jgi:uncharacterized protein (TIGR02996 family)
VDDTEERLLAQIRANPADDAPRMVYADHLTSRGEERGEYIALALAHARNELSGERASRFYELDRRDKQWAKELGCDGVQVIRWRRGFPEVLGGHSSDAEKLAKALRLPFRELILRHGGDIREVARIPELSTIESLQLCGPLLMKEGDWTWSEFPPEELEVLLLTPRWSSLRAIELGEGSLTDRGAAVIARASWRPQLEELAIFQGTLTGDGLGVMLGRSLPRLRVVRLWKVRVADAGAGAIDGCELPALESVTLGFTGLTPAGARVLFGSRNLATVTWLQLVGHELGGSLDALARSPHAAALRAVDLESNYLQDEDAIALASGTFPALGSLDVHHNSIGDAGAIALAAGNGFPAVVTLDLHENSIGDAGATALAGSQGFPRLAHLDLQSNQLTRAGVLPFTRTALPSLVTLAVSQNPLPNGETRNEIYYDQGYEVGGATVDVAYSSAEVASWFSDAGSPIKVR